MKKALLFTAASLPILFLANCASTGTAGNSGSSPSGTGPFDSRGNYVEDWADSPSKWKRGGSAPISKPGGSLVIAANDEPPANSVPIPLPTAGNTREPADIGTTPIISRPPPSRAVKSSQETTATSRPKTKPKTNNASKATASKTKPKKKATVRYTVKKGDTLSGIASRNGTTVAALQRANGIKGSIIQRGKTLVIPK